MLVKLKEKNLVDTKYSFDFSKVTEIRYNIFIKLH